MNWEYSVIEYSYPTWETWERRLNELGNQGWELVSVAVLVGDRTGGLQAFLKRPRTDK